MDKWESVVERLIRESMERGEFDDLSGSGRPIDLEENPFEDPDLRTAHRLLRNAGFAPAWIEERKDIESSLQLARDILERAGGLFNKRGSVQSSQQWNRAVKEFREKTVELNQRIRLYNLKAPAMTFHLKIIDPESLIREIESNHSEET